MAANLTLYNMADDDHLLALLSRVEDLADLDEGNATRSVALAELVTYSAELGLTRKVDAYCHLMASFEGMVTTADEEIERLKSRKARILRAHKRLETMAELALSLLPETGRAPRLEGSHTALVLRENPPAVAIHNQEAIPVEFLSVEVTMPLGSWMVLKADAYADTIKQKPRLALIRDSLKRGFDVPGASLTAGFRVERK